MLKRKGKIQYAVIKTVHGVTVFLTENNKWSNKWYEAALFDNEKIARDSVVSKLEDFNTKRFIDGSPAT